MPRTKKFAFFGYAIRRSAPDTLSRRPHIEKVKEQIELDIRVGIIRFVVLSKFLVTPDTLGYLISLTGKIPRSKTR